MIKKTLLFGVLALVALVLGAPALVGLYLARDFDRYAAQLDRPGLVQVVSMRFARGWFQSDASIGVRLADRFCDAPPCATLTLRSTIHHGPVPFTAPIDQNSGLAPALAIVTSRLDLAPLWPRLTFEPALDPMTIVTRAGFDGQVESTARLPASRFGAARAAPVAQVSIAPLIISAEAGLNGGPIVGRLAWPLLKIVGEESGQLELRELEARVRTAAADRNRIVAQQLRLNSLTIGDGRGLSALLQGIVWQAEAVSGSNDAGATRFESRISRLVLNTGEYGPMIVQGRVEGADLSLWQALKDQFVTGDSSSGPDRSTLRALYELYLPPVLAAGPVFDIERFLLTTPEGDISGEVRVAIPDDMRPPDSIKALLAQVEIDFEGRLPTPLLRAVVRDVAAQQDAVERPLTDQDIDQAIALLTRRGLIEAMPQADAYRLRLQVAKGRMVINDRPQPGWNILLDQLKQADEGY